MRKYFFRNPALLLGVSFLCSCSSANNKPILIRFSQDSTAIVFSDIDPAGLLEIRNKPGIDTAYQHIISVLQTPGENDSLTKEAVLPGKVQVTDSTIKFIPLVPFVRGKSYLAVTDMNIRFGGAVTALRGKLNGGGKSTQVILRR